MKMKSKFFGLSAKLALAILAVSTTLTSCYDSENGDVTKPYKAPNAVYTFVVNVIDGITGKPVSNATVTAGTTACANVGNGVYQVVVNNDQTGTKMPASLTISVSATNYEAASQTIAVAEITNGQAITCYANVILNATVYQPDGLKIAVSASATSKEGSITGDQTQVGADVVYDATLDVINSADSPMNIMKDITVFKGVKYSAPVTRALTDAEIIAEIKKYINSVEGVTVGDIFVTEVRPYSFLLPARSALQKISIRYNYEEKSYTFTYGTRVFTAKTKRVVSVIFSNTAVTIDVYHGHGHGHGHGGDLNAGGGIFE